MMFKHFRVSLAMALAGFVVATSAMAQDKPEEILKAKGIRRLGAALALNEEPALAKMLSDAAKLKKSVNDAVAELTLGERKASESKQLILTYTQQRRMLRVQIDLAKNNVDLHNRLVDQYNELGDRITLLEGTDFNAQLKPLREKANAAREGYVQHVLDMRKLADKLERMYAELPADPQVKSAIEKLNQETGGKYELVESRGFQGSQRSLKKVEDSVLSETISMRSEGDTYNVSTVLNGKHTKELCIDSGSSYISLPHKIAVEIGVEPKSADREIVLQLADGSEVTAKVVNLPSVRVGKFTVENVECAVMPATLPNASAILGMSFLRNFSFKIDSETGKLTMTKVDTPPVKGK